MRARKRIREYSAPIGNRISKEVYVKADIQVDDLLFVVDGRCDGLLGTEPLLTVDEIKSTGGDLERITEDGYPVHWAQALFYAYMYAKEHGRLRLCAFSLPMCRRKRRRNGGFSRGQLCELEQYVHEIAARYAPYAQLRRRHEQARNESIRELAFPFDAYRAGQRKLAGAVYKSIEEGVRCLRKRQRA